MEYNKKIRRKFNITGQCNPKFHYMVMLEERLHEIRERYVEQGSYFVINRGRQYGKTTTLRALEEYLTEEYLVISMDFQEISTEEYKDEFMFAAAFMRKFTEALEEGEASEEEKRPLINFLKKAEHNQLSDMFHVLGNICKMSVKPVVLMIDEVDNASNNQVFIDFLAQLRARYLKRDKIPTFHSVILAGVYNIKNLKLKLRPESEHQYNSPWNIAADYDIKMNFSSGQIASMLEEYETDYHTGMNIQEIAEQIYQYTSGYPVLVSSICKYMDEKITGSDNFENRQQVWTKRGVEEAVKRILVESTPLFESMVRHLDSYPEMKKMFQTILFQGSEFTYNPYAKEISLACMFGYAVNKDGKVQIANRIFETCLYNYFYSEEELSNAMVRMAKRDKSYFIHDDRLDMDTVMEKFVEYFHDIYGQNDARFVEDNGRKLFLLYLRPIINGAGNYYVEARTRNERRTDIIVDYRGEQFIIELKIWHGNEYNEKGKKQLADYLDCYHKDKGYLLSFNFNKSKEIGVKEIRIGNKTIVEAVV